MTQSGLSRDSKAPNDSSDLLLTVCSRIPVTQPIYWGPDRVLRDPLRVSDNRIGSIWGKWAMKELANAGEAALVMVTVIALVVVIGLPMVSEWRRRHRRRY